MRLAYFALILLLAVATCSAHEDVASENEPTARATFRLPKLFDFQRFKAFFQKRYSSALEELVRQKIFLARAFQAFISSVAYKNRKSDSYLAVNQMSDWTPDDINRSRIRADGMADINDLIMGPDSGPKSRIIGSGQLVVVEEPEASTADQVPAVSVEDVERQLSEIRARQDEPLYRELAQELESLERQKREADEVEHEPHPNRRHLSPDDLMRAPRAGGERPEVAAKLRRRGVPGNNPHYEPPELMSQGVQDEQVDWPKMAAEFQQKAAADFQKMAGDFFEGISKHPAANFLGNMIKQALTPPDPKQRQLEEEARLRRQRAKYTLEEVDLRQRNCLVEPRGQGVCGACYAFAAIAMYEYIHCMRTGEMVEFSEQYLVDCGHRVDLDGCKGGGLSKTAKFVDEFGLELRKNYPYHATPASCPYDNSTEPAKMGYLKLEDAGYALIKIDFIHKFISKGPMMVGLKLGPNFRHYGGGIDANPNCSDDDRHGMLLVGSGREEGREYWILRNSHTPKWGEQGYWRLTKERLYDCSIYDYGVTEWYLLNH